MHARRRSRLRRKDHGAHPAATQQQQQHRGAHQEELAECLVLRTLHTRLRLPVDYTRSVAVI